MEACSRKDQQEEETSPRAWEALVEPLHSSTGWREKTYHNRRDAGDEYDIPICLHATTSAVKKRWWVIVVVVSVLRGIKAPVCSSDVFSREVCCLPGPPIQEENTKSCIAHWPLSTDDVDGHQWYSQEQAEEYEEGLQSPGSSDKGLGSAGSFLINPSNQTEGFWKVQLNLASQQMLQDW